MLPLRDHLPTRTFPFVNYLLIGANVIVFAFQLQGQVSSGFEFRPYTLFQDPGYGVETIFTSMFMHGGLAHIAGNMLFLWIFGDNVEDAMGHARYLLFYLLGGLCAALAQTMSDPSAHIPMLGASGAISSVLAAYLFLYPRSPITVLNPIPLLWIFWGLFLLFPAWLVIAMWFFAQLWSAISSNAEAGVAFMAHVGGFVAGAVLYRLFLAGRERRTEYERHSQWAQPRRRIERY